MKTQIEQTTVLIVDDSVVARAQVSGLLRDGSGLKVVEATDGVDAMKSIEWSQPDIVVTDLKMPRTDGLQLVKSIHSGFPQIPVVIITGEGSEELAVDALKSGAAAYVPKNLMSRDLVSTVMHLLAASRSGQDMQRMKSCWFENHSKFTLENDANLIAPLVSTLRQNVEELNTLDETESLQLGMAVEQAISNAIFHGNLELTNEDLDSIEYELSGNESTVVDFRLEEQPYCDRKVYVEWTVTRSEVRIVVRDEGFGFDVATIPPPEKMLALDELSGRGITYMRMFADEIRFNDAGNEVVLIKHGRAASSAGRNRVEMKDI